MVGLVLAAVALSGWLLLPYAFQPPRRLPPVPFDRTTSAVIPGIPGARYFVMQDLEPMIRALVPEYRTPRDSHPPPIRQDAEERGALRA